MLVFDLVIRCGSYSTSAMINLAMLLLQLMSVCKPLRYKSVVTTRVCKQLLVILCLLAFSVASLFKVINYLIYFYSR